MNENLVLRARLPLLWQRPTQVRIGTDPRWAVVLDDLSPAAARALLAVRPGASVRVLRATLTRERVPAAEADIVLGHLESAHLLVAPHPSETPDAATWSLLEASGDGAAVLRRRSGARVRVCGLCRVGGGLAMTLANAGIGRLELEDDAAVSRHESGWAGLTLRDVGTPRTEALFRALRDAVPAVRTQLPGSAQVDLVVLVEHGVADPVRSRELLSAGVAHLPVVLREASVMVGPLIRSGGSPCLRCVELHRGERDPGWPAVAAQLAARATSFPAESTLAAVAAALAATAVLAHVDGRATSVDGAALEVRLPDALPRRTLWPAHPDCGCAGLPS